MDHVMLQTYSLTWWQNIVKNLFHKAQEEGKDLYQCLMMYRNTPLSSTLQSPMQYSQTEQLDQVYPCQMQQGDKKV